MKLGAAGITIFGRHGEKACQYGVQLPGDALLSLTCGGDRSVGATKDGAALIGMGSREELVDRDAETEEVGPPAHDLHGMGPGVVLHNLLGSKGIGAGNAATFNMFYWFNRAYRAHFSAHSMEGFKIAQLTRIASRAMMKGCSCPALQ